MTDDVTAAVKLLAVEQELEFADEQDYQHAIALGVAAYRDGFEAGRQAHEAVLAQALDLDDQRVLTNEIADYQGWNDQYHRNGS